MENIVKVRNSSIDIFRYICAILVVIIHTHPLSDLNANADYITSQIITRIGVPFFFAVAGFFYSQKIEKGQFVFVPYIKKLFMTYCFWSFGYILIDFFEWGYGQIKGFIVTGTINFLFKGSHYHFWFFPALIISICLMTFFYRINCKKLLIPLSLVLFVIGCIGCSYYELGVKIPLMGKLYTFSEFTALRRIFMMGFPFFICGYFVNKIKNTALMLSNKKLFTLLFLAITVWLAEIFLVVKLEIQRDIIITFALYPLLVVVMLILLKNPLPQFNKLSQKCRVIANITYYTHPLFILLIKTVYNDAPKFLVFLLTLILTLALGLLLSKSNNRFIKLITG